MTSNKAEGKSPGPLVAIGGGRGLSNSIRALKRLSEQVVAVVSVADDGGSSGRLRQALGISPPGDLRKSLVALAEESSLEARVLEYRFEQGELKGHPVGNVLLAGLFELTGDVVSALEVAARMVGAKGRVYPASLTPVLLRASTQEGDLEGQVRIAQTPGAKRLSFFPEDPEPPRQVMETIASARAVLLGPGSLYTSVIAAAALPRIKKALSDCPGSVIYICNIREQHRETEGFSVADHVRALIEHDVRVDVVIHDPRSPLLRGEVPAPLELAEVGDEGLAGHDPAKLAAALARLLA